MWICPECRQIYDTHVVRCERDDAPVAEVFAHQTKARYPLLGRIVGDRYHLIGGLGQGGLGTVYLAQHRHLGQLFAVKFLDLQSIGAGQEIEEQQKAGYRRDFLREAQVASLVRHPSVVRVTDFGEHDGLPFLVMEYVPGPSLLQMLGSRGRFPVPEAVAIVRRIAEALDAFHERRLVHRDMKPANVILDPRGDGRLTLVDLGLVKDLSGIGARASTHPLALRGTPGYLAPEQVPAWVLAQQGVKSNNEKRIVDARVDLYALGVIFYEVLAGVSPYPDGSNTAVIVYACTHDPIPFSSVEPALRVPAALEALVCETMNRDPEKRPATAAEFLERLDAVTMGQAVQGSWPSILAPGAGAGAARRPESNVPLSSPAQAMPPAADPLARLSRLASDEAQGDPEEALESTAVFTEGDADVSAENPARRAAQMAEMANLVARADAADAAAAAAIASADGRRPTGPVSPIELRKASHANPDRTLEADVVDDALDDGEALGVLARASANRSAPPVTVRESDSDPSSSGVPSPATFGPGRDRTSVNAGAELADDGEFELDANTRVERMSPGLATAVQPLPERSMLPVSVPPEVVLRPEPARRSAGRTETGSPWRIPVAVLLVALAAGTGWFFARQSDVPDQAPAEVVRVGNVQPPAGETPSAQPHPVSAQVPVPATAAPTLALPPPPPSAAPPRSAAPRNGEASATPKPATGILDQLLTEGDAAMRAKDYKTALERYEAFSKRAGQGHPQYYDVQFRLEKVRGLLQGK